MLRSDFTGKMEPRVHEQQAEHDLSDQIKEHRAPLAETQQRVGFVHERGIGGEGPHESRQQDHAGFGIEWKPGFQKTEDKAEEKSAQHVDDPCSQGERTSGKSLDHARQSVAGDGAYCAAQGDE